MNQNAGQATAATGQTALIAGLEADLSNAFTQINGLTATAGYTSVSATALNGLNTQDGINRTYVINVTSGLQVSSKINITGDGGDVFVMRWDTDANAANGYQGQVKFQSGGAIVPLGGLTAGNFIHVAGDINSSGGGSTPASPYPQGPRLDDGLGNLPVDAQNFNGGGFFTGYWLTTGDQALSAANSESRGITGDAQGTTLWVLDRNKNVYVSTTSGVAQGSWTASDLSTSPEAIAKDGNHLWMVDSSNKRVYWYQNAALNTSGTDKAEKTFSLATAVVPKGLTTDGNSLWVVSDSTANTVFRYTIVKDGSGNPTGLTPSGSWTLAAANTTPTGITLDPTGMSKSLWVVDSGTDTVYEYANGTLLSSGSNVAAIASFKLSSGNTTPQDIFDPLFTQAPAQADSVAVIAAAPDALTGLVGTDTAASGSIADVGSVEASGGRINPGQPSPAWLTASSSSSSSELLGNPGLDSLTASLDDGLLKQLNNHPFSAGTLLGVNGLTGTALV